MTLHQQTDGRLTAAFEPGIATMWVTLPAAPVASITPQLVADFRQLAAGWREAHERSHPSADQAFKFMVVKGPSADVFNLGGDLAMIADLAERRDADGLTAYARSGAEACHLLSSGLGCCVQTIALVRGLALGGGFETARCCDYMIAEEGVVLQLPEVGNGMFPGNGITSVLAPRIGARLARELTLSGRRVGAREGLALGILDAVHAPGTGEAEIRNLIARLTPGHAAGVAMARGLNRRLNISREGLIDEADYWAAATALIPDSSIARMRRLAGIQRRSFRAPPAPQRDQDRRTGQCH